MTEFSIYQISTGEVVRYGSSNVPLSTVVVASGEGIVEGEFPCDTYYISDGVQVKYTPEQATAKAQITGFLSQWSNTTMQWIDTRTLQAIKTSQWETIKQARSAAEYAGFAWDGSTFDSDATSQNRITGAVTLAQMSAAFSVDWILADNTVRTLNQSDMLQVGAALGAHVAAQFSTGVARRAQIDAATTKEAVEAITWSQP